MRIVFYSQHVLGMGHLFRSLEIATALAPHHVDLVTGGEHVALTLPAHVRHIPLPPLCMDADFQTLQTCRSDLTRTGVSQAASPSQSTDEVMTRRRRRLMEHLREVQPDLFLVELFPFGRKRFGFELLPVLEASRRGELGRCRTVCSVRDILVEKQDPASYEARVVHQLNTYFDLVLVHADPRLVRLEETFASVEAIVPRIVYTGYVVAPVDAAKGLRLRQYLELAHEEEMIVASIGGGAVGRELLEAVLDASTLLQPGRPHHLWVFTGPFLSEVEFTDLCQRAAGRERVHVHRFTENFGDWLSAADLSVSMAGYNTTMNLLAAKTFGLVWPYGQNREQSMRAERLEHFGLLSVLRKDDLVPEQLAVRMVEALGAASARRPAVDFPDASNDGYCINLDGATATRNILECFCGDARHG
ncbi:glycosyltransferase family protein [Desulfonatronum thioautotrophicum]|uniref:glycosyltransferase family protein n=1 Tax=Desulfonatronum thioautotrophicum TaxID=617001 RepID=UPI00069A7C79|nr:glycosyltransferase [Desulfonatronum thioautotrophicum]